MAEDSWGLLGSNRQLALLRLDQWRQEIERAITQVKRPVDRTGLDPWLRRRWYMAQARRRKRDRRLAQPWVRRGGGGRADGRRWV